MISIVLGVDLLLARALARVAEAALAREREKSERIEREAALANLRALQAQIEPHFLFNTLANVTSLIDPDPGEGEAHAGELQPLPARVARRHAQRVDHARRRGAS